MAQLASSSPETLAVTLDDNSVCIGKKNDAAKVLISFERTIRVSDNENASDLPPSLGKFPLYHVKNYADKLPPHMASNGGLFMPMYRKKILLMPHHVGQVLNYS